MYSQDGDENKLGTSSTGGGSGPKPLLISDDRQKKFEYYVLNQETTRNFYGLTMEEKKLKIVDKAKLEERLKADGEKKEWLRELWKRTNGKE